MATGNCKKVDFGISVVFAIPSIIGSRDQRQWKYLCCGQEIMGVDWQLSEALITLTIPLLLNERVPSSTLIWVCSLSRPDFRYLSSEIAKRQFKIDEERGTEAPNASQYPCFVSLRTRFFPLCILHWCLASVQKRRPGSIIWLTSGTWRKS